MYVPTYNTYTRRSRGSISSSHLITQIPGCDKHSECVCRYTSTQDTKILISHTCHPDRFSSLFFFPCSKDDASIPPPQAAGERCSCHPNRVKSSGQRAWPSRDINWLCMLEYVSFMLWMQKKEDRIKDLQALESEQTETESGFDKAVVILSVFSDTVATRYVFPVLTRCTRRD